MIIQGGLLNVCYFLLLKRDVAFHLIKIELSLSPLCLVKDLKFHQFLQYYYHLPLEKENALLFSFVSNLVEIGPLVLDKKIFNCRQTAAWRSRLMRWSRKQMVESSNPSRDRPKS